MKKTIALLLISLLVVSFAAGCGKNEPAKPAPTAKAEPIIIAYTPWNGYGALFVAAQKGMFKAKGVDVQIQSIEDVGARKQSIVAKKIQGMAASVDVSVAAIGQGVPIKFVWAFDASAGADGLLVLVGAETALDRLWGSTLQKLLVLGLASLLGFLTYLVVARLLRVREVAQAVSLVRRRVGR